MKQILIAVMIAAFMLVSACTPSQVRYKENPVTKEELTNRIGQPDKVVQTEDGKEKLVYAYPGFEVSYVYIS